MTAKKKHVWPDPLPSAKEVAMKVAFNFRVVLVLLGVVLFAFGVKANAVTEWNLVAVNAIPPLAATGPVGSRVLGYVHVAMFDAVNAVERRYAPYKVDVSRPGASAEAAAMAAAHGILVRIYLGQRIGLDATLAKSLSALPEGEAREEGIALGRLVAERTEVAVDDFGAPDPAFQMGATPSSWRPYPASAPPRGLGWGKIKPFALSGGGKFELPGPLPVRSPDYARELGEVRRLGGRDSPARTAEQTATAIFFTVGGGPLLNDVARQEANARGLDLPETARLFALINIAMSDAMIAGMREKWRHDSPRPVTAIRAGQTLGNPAIEQDSAWEPLIITPNFPDYPSLHSANSAAGATILRKIFGGDTTQARVSVTYPLGGVTRSWTTYTDLVSETTNARVWGGLHTRTACEHGEGLGQRIAEFVFDAFLQPSKETR
jgi:hypothetical protein